MLSLAKTNLNPCRADTDCAHGSDCGIDASCSTLTRPTPGSDLPGTLWLHAGRPGGLSLSEDQESPRQLEEVSPSVVFLLNNVSLGASVNIASVFSNLQTHVRLRRCVGL